MSRGRPSLSATGEIKRVEVKFPADQADACERAANAADQKLAEWIREACQEKLDRTF